MPLITGQSGVGLIKILKFAEPILVWILTHEAHQDGGVFCVAEPKTGTPLLLCVFGCLRIDEYNEYMAFAIEKAKRLAENPSHFASSESRDMTTTPKRYGGAVRGKDFILSFSGFKEEQDEAAMLLLEWRLRGGSINVSPQLKEIAERGWYFSFLEQQAC